MLVIAPPASAQLDVAVSRSAVSTRLGDDFGFSTRITNRGATPLSGLVAHLNVVGLSSGIYVDPEDWSSERTRYLPPIPAGGSTTLPWPIKAVNGGSLRGLRRRPAWRQAGRPPDDRADAASRGSPTARRSTPGASSRSRSACRLSSDVLDARRPRPPISFSCYRKRWSSFRRSVRPTTWLRSSISSIAAVGTM